MTNQEPLYGVVVRDGDLYVFLGIKRKSKGDVYELLAMPNAVRGGVWDPCAPGAWDLHESYHRSGQRHSRSYGHMSSKQQRQKPDSTLQGVEYVGARVIADREPRAFGARYDAKFFSGIFEISADLLSSEKYRTALEIDLAEPQESSIVPINASDKSQIIRQEIFKDAIPWIVVTLYDMWNPWFRETLAADKLSEKAQKQKSQPSSSAFRSRLF